MAKIGLQFYSVRKQAKRDLPAAIRKIANAGYDGIEFDAGMLERIDASDLKTLMDEVGLETIGLTLLMPELGASLDPMIQYGLTVGAEWLVMPWFEKKLHVKPNGYEIVAHALNKAAKRAAKFGLRFAYHIHGYEFDLIDNQRGIDILLSILDPNLVELQLDTFWVASAGVDPVDFAKEHIDQIGSFHMKDAASLTPLKNTEVGRGVLDMFGIVKLGLKAGINWYIVEQEQSQLPIYESIAVSQENLHRMIQSEIKKT